MGRLRRRRRRAAGPLVAGVLLLTAACGRAGAPPGPPAAAGGPAADSLPRAAGVPQDAPFWFVDIAREAGLTAPTWCGGKEKPHILESGGGGLALLDYDGDGDLDLYVVNGWRLDGAVVVERGRNHLYRNRGDAHASRTSPRRPASATTAGATGVAVGDVDGDGRPDLFVTQLRARRPLPQPRRRHLRARRRTRRVSPAGPPARPSSTPTATAIRTSSSPPTSTAPSPRSSRARAHAWSGTARR